MRKVKVKCTAANDDEDFGGLIEEKEPKRSRISQPSNTDAAAEQSPPIKSKKEKEFAWMDSEDEVDAEASEEDHKQEADEEVTVDKLDMVQRFGQMVMLTDSLHQKLKSNSFGPAEVAAACRALARSRYFDGELLEGLCTSLVAMIADYKLSGEQATDVVVCLKALNYYNQGVFTAIAKAFTPKVTTLSPAIRSTWLDAMQSLGHKSDPGFLQILEVLPLLPANPSYRKIRCTFFARGSCELGELCTYAHNELAPLSLDDTGSKEDAWRKRSVIMTHDQMYVFKERETGQSRIHTASRTITQAPAGSNGPLPPGPLGLKSGF